MIGHLLHPDLEPMLRAKQWDQIREGLSDLPAADVAEIIEYMLDLPGCDEAVLFRLLPREQAALVFAHLPLHRQRRLVQSFSMEDAGTLLNEMTPDDRTRLLEEMPAEVTKRLLDELSPEELKRARELLGYPERTAGRYMTPEYVELPPAMKAREALEHIRKTGRGKETLSILYVVDENGKLVEDIRLGSLVLADPEMPVADIEDRPLVSIVATLPIEEVIASFRRYGRGALPVVDADGKMLGIVTQDDVLELAQAEATEDIQRLGGSDSLDAPYLKTEFWAMVRKRGGWLSALFLGEMLTATAMGYFEGEIERAAVVALFVPLIISSGGNSGSQATSLIIRSLALKEMTLRHWVRVFGKELFSGLALGFFLGLIGLVRILVWYKLGWNDYKGHPFAMGMTVWLSLIGVVTFGSLAGAMLPFILRRLGFDPATSSAPFVATLVDVTGLCIYFLVAMLILRTTLLAPDHAPRKAQRLPNPPVERPEAQRFQRTIATLPEDTASSTSALERSSPSARTSGVRYEAGADIDCAERMAAASSSHSALISAADVGTVWHLIRLGPAQETRVTLAAAIGANSDQLEHALDEPAAARTPRGAAALWTGRLRPFH